MIKAEKSMWSTGYDKGCFEQKKHDIQVVADWCDEKIKATSGALMLSTFRHIKKYLTEAIARTEK